MVRTKACLLTFALAATLGASAARAGDREFHEIVNRMAQTYGKKPMPFMGFVSFAARFAQPEGVSDFKMAIFDGVNTGLSPDAARFDAFVQGVAGSNYHPLVRVRSGRDSEQTYIYVREAGSGWEMLLVTVEPSDAVVMKMHLNPEAMERWIDDPVENGKKSAHGGGEAHFD